MFRRHDKLGQMAATLFAAVVCGAIFEAEGLRIWAERLNVGSLRDNAVPITAGWSEATRWAHTALPRDLALQAKAALADDFAPAKPDTRLAESADAPAATPAEAAASDAGQPMQVAAADLELASLKRHAGAPAPTGGAVILSGDSMMAVGLAPTLTRWLGREKNARVVRAFRSGTGLSRPDVYDWQVEYPRMVGAVQPALIICSMGANDAQNVQVGKKVLAFGSPEWDALYNARLTAYLDMISRYKAPVLWVGLPTMKSPVFAAKMAHMNALIQAGVVRYPQITWLDANPPLGYNHGFQQFKANDKGKLIKLRADDGIHLTDEGALFLVPAINQWLSKTDRTPKQEATLAQADATPAPAVASTKPIKPAKPIAPIPAQAQPKPEAPAAMVATAPQTIVPQAAAPQTTTPDDIPTAKSAADTWLHAHAYPRGWSANL